MIPLSLHTLFPPSPTVIYPISFSLFVDRVNIQAVLIRLFFSSIGLVDPFPLPEWSPDPAGDLEVELSATHVQLLLLLHTIFLKDASHPLPVPTCDSPPFFLFGVLLNVDCTIPASSTFGESHNRVRPPLPCPSSLVNLQGLLLPVVGFPFFFLFGFSHFVVLFGSS